MSHTGGGGGEKGDKIVEPVKSEQETPDVLSMECTDVKMEQDDDDPGVAKTYPVGPSLSVALSSTIAVSPSRKRPAEESDEDEKVEESVSIQSLAEVPKYYYNNTEVLISAETLRILTKGQPPPEKKMKLSSNNNPVLEATEGKSKGEDGKENNESVVEENKDTLDKRKGNDGDMKDADQGVKEEKEIQSETSNQSKVEENKDIPVVRKVDGGKMNEDPMEILIAGQQQVQSKTSMGKSTEVVTEVKVQSETSKYTSSEVEIEKEVQASSSESANEVQGQSSKCTSREVLTEKAQVQAQTDSSKHANSKVVREEQVQTETAKSKGEAVPEAHVESETSGGIVTEKVQVQSETSKCTSDEAEVQAQSETPNCTSSETIAEVPVQSKATRCTGDVVIAEEVQGQSETSKCTSDEAVTEEVQVISETSKDTISSKVAMEEVQVTPEWFKCTRDPTRCHFQTKFFTNFRQHTFIHHGAAVHTRIATLYHFLSSNIDSNPRFYENPYSGVLQCSYCIANFSDQDEGARHLMDEHCGDREMFSCRLHGCSYVSRQLNQMVLHVTDHLGIKDFTLLPNDFKSIASWCEDAKKPCSQSDSSQGIKVAQNNKAMAKKSARVVANEQLPEVADISFRSIIEKCVRKGIDEGEDSTNVASKSANQVASIVTSGKATVQNDGENAKESLPIDKQQAVEPLKVITPDESLTDEADSILLKEGIAMEVSEHTEENLDKETTVCITETVDKPEEKEVQVEVTSDDRRAGDSSRRGPKRAELCAVTNVGSSSMIVAVFKDVDFTIDEDVVASERQLMKELEGESKDSSKMGCVKCNANFTKVIHAVEHRRLHSGIKPLTCSYCEFQSAQESVMRTHILRKHQSIIQGTTRASKLVYDAATNTYTCPFCPSTDVIFGSKKNAEEHLKIHGETGNEMVYTCFVCGFDTLKRMKIVNHVLYDNCQLLNKDWAKGDHSKVHVCGQQVINSTFKSEEVLNPPRDSAVQSGSKLSSAISEHVSESDQPSISSKVEQSEPLESHVFVKTSNQTDKVDNANALFKCSLCSFHATERKAVFYHIKDSHKRTQTECYDTYTYVIGEGEKSTKLSRNPVTGLYHCPFCNEKAARQSTGVFVHIRAVHTKERPYKCKYCSYDSVNWSDIFHHGKRWHDVEVNAMIQDVSKNESKSSAMEIDESRQESNQSEVKKMENQEQEKKVDDRATGSQKLSHWVVEETWVEGLGTSFTLKKADSFGVAESSEGDKVQSNNQTKVNPGDEKMNLDAGDRKDDTDEMDVDVKKDVSSDADVDVGTDSAKVKTDAIITSGVVREVFLPANVNVDYIVNISSLEDVALTEMKTYGRYACDQCYLTIQCFGPNMTYLYFNKYHSQGKKFSGWHCSHCTTNCKKKEDLLTHLKEKHEIDGSEGVKNSSKDEQIKVSERAKDLVMKHVRVEHLQAMPPFVCMLCDFRAMSAQHLSYHLNLCHRKHATGLPDATMEPIVDQDEDGLEVQEEKDEVETSSESEGYTFESGMFEKYMRKFKCPVTERYACGFCRLTFDFWIDLKNHVRSHINEKPYTCIKCKCKTMTKMQMKYHVSTCGTKLSPELRDHEYGRKVKLDVHVNHDSPELRDHEYGQKVKLKGPSSSGPSKAGGSVASSPATDQIPPFSNTPTSTTASGSSVSSSSTSNTTKRPSAVTVPEAKSAPILYQKLCASETSVSKNSSTAAKSAIMINRDKNVVMVTGDEPMDTSLFGGEDFVQLGDSDDDTISVVGEDGASGYFSSSSSNQQSGDLDGSGEESSPLAPYGNGKMRARRRLPHEMTPGPQLGIDYTCDIPVRGGDVKDLKNVCPYCGRDFQSQNNLVIHMRTHTGEKPYHCLHCGFSSGYDTSIRRHFRLNRCHVLRMKMKAANDPSTAMAMISNVDKAVQLISSIREEIKSKDPSIGITAAKISKDGEGSASSNESNNDEQKQKDLADAITLNDSEKASADEIVTENQKSSSDPTEVRKETEERSSNPQGTEASAEKTTTETSPKPSQVIRNDPIKQLHHMSSKLGNKLIPTVGYKSVPAGSPVPLGPILDVHYTFKPSPVEQSAVVTLRTSKFLDCLICKHRADTLDQAISHLRSHTGDKPFHCCFCGYKTAHELAIRNHYQLQHQHQAFDLKQESDVSSPTGLTPEGTEKDVTLPEWPSFFAKRRFIDFDFQVSEKERRAVSMFIQSGSSKCDVCNIKLHDRFSVTNHVRKHNNEKPYRCLHCNERFDAANQMANHLQYDHPHLNAPPPPPLVPIQQGISRVPCPNPVAIQQGEIVSPNAVIVKTEPRSPGRASVDSAPSHVEDDPMQLEPVWPRHFAVRRNIDFTFTMSVFERAALRKFFLTGVYLCDTCNAQCKTRIDITAHVRRHNQEKPYKCLHCHATFDSAMPMMVHCDQYHKETSPTKQDPSKPAIGVAAAAGSAASETLPQQAETAKSDALSSLYGMDSIKQEKKKSYLKFPARGVDYTTKDEIHLKLLREKYQKFPEYFCPKCQLESPTIEDALDHMVEDHAYAGFRRSFQCSTCYEKCYNEKNMRNHIVVHHTRSAIMAEKLYAGKELTQKVGEEYVCLKLGCGQVSKTKIDHNCHRRKCQAETEYYCTMCPFKETDKSVISTHCFNKHTTLLSLERDPFTGNFLCTFCNKIWTHLNDDGKAHSCKMSGIGTWYVCKDCNFTSVEKSVVLLHKLFYHSERAEEFVLPGQLVTPQNANSGQGGNAEGTKMNASPAPVKAQVSPGSASIVSPSNSSSPSKSSPRPQPMTPPIAITLKNQYRPGGKVSTLSINY